MKRLPSLLLFIVLTMLLSVAAQAKSPVNKAFAESETTSLNILMSSSNTGVIEDTTCPTCNFKFVKITPNTLAYASGKRVNISQAVNRYGKSAFIRFNAKTGEVVFISWDE